LAVELGEEEVVELDPENIPDVGDLISVCAGLVVVDQESAVIRLVHYTTQEYFERVRDTWNPGAKLLIAITCLTYISFNAFRSGGCSTDEDFEKRLRQNDFLGYAARNWAEHARSVETEVASLACLFLLHTGLLSSATQVLDVPVYKYRGYSQKYPATTALHWTARFGLCAITEKLFLTLEEEITHAINTQDSDGLAPLAVAAEHGRCEMAKLLLDKGADISAQGGHYGNALQAATSRGHIEIVKLLLDKGADINAQCGRYDNALQAASYGGYMEIVKLLLDNGADISAQGRLYSNTLQAASYAGHIEIVKLLLDKGADISAQGGHYGNALQAASYKGHELVVKLLLGKGAEIYVQGGYYGNALQAAVARGHEEVVKLLLRERTPPQLGNYRGGTAMSLASFHGHSSILQLLLSLSGVTAHPSDIYGRTLLWWAAAGGQADTVDLLIKQYYLDPREADTCGRTPLCIAAKKGHKAVSKLLSEECIKVDPTAMSTFERQVPSKSVEDQSSIYCDVCTSAIKADHFHYHCGICAGGDWDICEDCQMKGAPCLDVMHILVRRTKRGGVWINETSKL
jgi:ankyrin repeat protein